MATFTATHQFSAAAMAWQGGKLKAAATADATPSDAAPADSGPPTVQAEAVLESVPVMDVPPEPEPEAKVPDPVPDPITAVLQKKVQPWRLLSSRTRTTIGRRPKTSRSPKDVKKVHVL